MCSIYCYTGTAHPNLLKHRCWPELSNKCYIHQLCGGEATVIPLWKKKKKKGKSTPKPNQTTRPSQKRNQTNKQKRKQNNKKQPNKKIFQKKKKKSQARYFLSQAGKKTKWNQYQKEIIRFISWNSTLILWQAPKAYMWWKEYLLILTHSFTTQVRVFFTLLVLEKTPFNIFKSFRNAFYIRTVRNLTADSKSKFMLFYL